MYLLTEDAQRDYRRERELMMDRPTPPPSLHGGGGFNGREICLLEVEECLKTV